MDLFSTKDRYFGSVFAAHRLSYQEYVGPRSVSGRAAGGDVSAKVEVVVKVANGLRIVVHGAPINSLPNG